MTSTSVSASALGVAGSDEDVLVIKVGTGIGCGIVVDGQVYRGAQGSAGDIGHISVPPPHGGCRTPPSAGPR